MEHGKPGNDSLEAYRLAARAWLSANLSRPDGGYDFEQDEDPAAGRVADARAVQEKLHAAGYAGITFPQAYGGQGLTLDHERVFREEAAGFTVPVQLFGVSVNILGATLAAFGSQEQKLRHIPRILSGRELWVQFLSEPSGGSDLAGLLTSATRDGDSYVVRGQKIWSSGAHLADFALCPVRTRWDVPKHDGISLLIIDLSLPGVQVRRIRQINDVARFCQVYFDDVVVPASCLVGEENDGWRVTRGLLEIEHAWVGRGGPRRAAGPESLADLIALCRETGRGSDAGVRRKLASLYVAAEVQRQLAARVSRGISAGTLQPDFGSLLKLGADSFIQERAATALQLAGTDGIAWLPGSAGSAGSWSREFLASRSVSIAGGTDEIMRNTVSERILRLPREMTPDRGKPFNQVPHN